MTVCYSLAAATASPIKSLQLLLRWRGSLWKAVFKEMIVWIVLLIGHTLLYYFLIKGSSFDNNYTWMLKHVYRYSIRVNEVIIVLSFVTKLILIRWQSVYQRFIWPENIAFTLKYFINEHSPESTAILAVSQRYLLLMYAFIFRDVNVAIRERYFPTYNSFIEKGLLTKEEKTILFKTQLKPSACRYWMPVLWIIQLVKERAEKKSRKEAFILEKHYAELITELNDFRAKVSDILSYDFVPIPLALTQLFTFFIYTTLVLGIFSFQAQVLEVTQVNDVASSLPLVLCTKFIYFASFTLFILGCLRIAHIILNPFGEYPFKDDDDFDMPYLLEKYCDSLYQILCVPTDIPTYHKGTKDMIPKLRHTVASAFLTRHDYNNEELGLEPTEGSDIQNEENVYYVDNE